MPTIAPRTVRAGTASNDRSYVISWEGLANGDYGVEVGLSGSADRSVQFVGTFGTGGTIQLEGSNDGSNWVVLTDQIGNSISKTAPAIKMVAELTKLVRPRVTAGDGSTSLNVYLLVKGAL